MRRVNPPFPDLLVGLLLDEEQLSEANLINREDLDALVAAYSERLNDKAAQLWFRKVLPGFLLKSPVDSRVATSEDLPEQQPAWMQKALQAGDGLSVFQVSDGTSDLIQKVVDYLNNTPTALTPRSTWNGVSAAASKARQAAEGNTWSCAQHVVNRSQDGGTTVYVITPSVPREGWATVVVRVQSRSKNVIEVENYEVNLSNSAGLREVALQMVARDGVNFDGGSLPVCPLTGGYAVHLLVSNGSRDWTGILMRNCIGGGMNGSYDRGSSCYAIRNEATGELVAALEFKNGRWAQKRGVANAELSPEAAELFQEFDRQPGLRVQKLDLVGGRMKLSNELAEGDSVDGTLFLEGAEQTELPAALSVSGDLLLLGSKLAQLPPKLSVRGKLDIRNTAVKHLPPDLSVGGLRATLGKIDHRDVCLYVVAQLEKVLRPKHAEWARNDRPPRNWTQAQISAHFDTNVKQSLTARVLAAKFGADDPEPAKDADIKRKLKEVYAE